MPLRGGNLFTIRQRRTRRRGLTCKIPHSPLHTRSTKALPASGRFIRLSRIYAPRADLPYTQFLSRSWLLEPRIETTLQVRLNPYLLCPSDIQYANLNSERVLNPRDNYLLSVVKYSPCWIIPIFNLPIFILLALIPNRNQPPLILAHAVSSRTQTPHPKLFLGDQIFQRLMLQIE